MKISIYELSKMPVFFLLFTTLSCIGTFSRKADFQTIEKLMRAIVQQNEPVALAIIEKSSRSFLNRPFSWEAADSTYETSFLLTACGNLGSPKIVKALIEKGCDVNRVVDWGFPLGVAASSNHTELISILLQNGAKKTVRNPAGQSAYDLAFANYHPEAVELLR